MLLPLHLNIWPDYYFPGGGGYKSKRSFTWAPDDTVKKRAKVVIKTDSKALTPQRKELKKIDPEFDQKRLDELREILAILRKAIQLNSKVSLMGYVYVSPKDIKEVEKKVQREEEDMILLLEII